MLLTSMTFIAGFAMLVLGGQFLVNSSVKIAERIGMSPLLIGLTLVAFGTSAPELVTSILASLAGSPGIAVGNVVGSNITNLLVILGFAALLCPISISSKVLFQDSLIMLGITALFTAMSFFLPLGRLVGSLYVVMLIGYIAYGWFADKQKTAPVTVEVITVRDGILTQISLVVLGLALLVGGGKFFVEAASDLARFLGMSETVIGLTIVAIGTSMPELITSVVATLKKQPDLALGNVVGSNIYNILGIAGLTGIIAPLSIPAEIFIDNWVMLGATVLAVAFFWRKRTLTRHEGMIMLMMYGLYIYWLLQR